jgi:hypothetical protein
LEAAARPYFLFGYAASLLSARLERQNKEKVIANLAIAFLLPHDRTK